jgi:hypothetical protein
MGLNLGDTESKGRNDVLRSLKISGRRRSKIEDEDEYEDD